MRLSAERSELLRLIGPVSRVVEARNTIPILSNLVISALPGDAPGFGGTIAIKGTDLDIEITAVGTATVDVGGGATVDAKRLEDIVKKLPASAVVSIELDDGQLIVKSGRSRFRLPTLPVDDYPNIAAGTFDCEFSVDLAALFKPVAFAISTEETRYYLNGIYLHAHAAGLRAVATDGHRLARLDVDMPDGAEALAGIIVPRKTVALVPPGVIEVSASATKIRMAADGLVVTSKVIDGKFPDYERVIPTANDKVAVANRDVLVSAVDRVAVMATGRAVKLSLAPDSMTLSARGETGDATDEIAVVYSDEPLDVGYNAGYLRDILSAFAGESVEIRVGDNTPGLFGDGSRLLCLLMGMRV